MAQAGKPDPKNEKGEKRKKLLVFLTQAKIERVSG